MQCAGLVCLSTAAIELGAIDGTWEVVTEKSEKHVFANGKFYCCVCLVAVLVVVAVVVVIAGVVVIVGCFC